MIERAFERRWLKIHNRRKVAVEAAAPLSRDTQREILRLTGKQVLLEETANAGLLAGIRIIVDEELLIDASARRRIGVILAHKQHSNPERFGIRML